MCDYYVYQLRLGSQDMPFYVGKGIGRRCYQHLTDWSRAKKSHKNNVINKALSNGDTIQIDIILDCLSEKEALAYEVYCIAAYGRYNDGGILTNYTAGGEGSSGYKHTKESLLKMAEIARNRSPESIDKMRNSLKGHVRSVQGNIAVSIKNAALSEDEYVHICILLHEGVPHRTIASAMGIGKTVVGYIKQIKKYKRWSHYYTNQLHKEYING